MEKHIKFLTAGLLIAMLISACGPVTTPPPAQPESLPQQGDSAPAAEPANTDEPAAASSDAPTEAQNDEPPMAVPTSRGDQLEATDPSTVMLASGGLQLVEFFRFT